MNIVTNPDNSKSQKIDLCIKVTDYLGVNYRPTHMVFDSENYDQQESLLDEFRDIAFAWTPGRSKENIPTYLRNIMDSPECKYLVWLSEKALKLDDVQFVWVLAHELRHIYQSRKVSQFTCIKSIKKKLRKEQCYKTLPGSLLGASEIDAEVCGLITVIDIFGKDRADELLHSGALRRCPYESYAMFIKQVAEECG